MLRFERFSTTLQLPFVASVNCYSHDFSACQKNCSLRQLSDNDSHLSIITCCFYLSYSDWMIFDQRLKMTKTCGLPSVLNKLPTGLSTASVDKINGLAIEAPVDAADTLLKHSVSGPAGYGRA